MKLVAAVVMVGGVLMSAAHGSPTEAALDVWCADALTKTLRDAYTGAARTLEMSGAAGEVVSGQIVVHSEASCELRAACSELRNGSSVIPAGAVRVQWVRYISIARNSPGVPQDELVALAPASIPDPFWDTDEVAVQPNEAQPLWVEITVPKTAAAGKYEGSIAIKGAGVADATVPVHLSVHGFQLSETRRQQVTNWFTVPGAGMKAERNTEAYWALARDLARLLVRHRQTCFNAQLGWIPTTYSKAQGFRCDFTELDRWAAVFFDAGMERMELFQAGRSTASVDNPACRIEPNDLAVTVKDKDVVLTAEQKLRGVLGELEKHVRKRGWHGRVMIHISDEPFIHCEPSYREVAAIVRQAAPSLKVIEAVETTGLCDVIDVLVPKLSHLNLWYPKFREAQGHGRELWFYTCCHPQGRYPNRFLDQPLVKARALHWIAYLYGLNGFLHWGLNWFAEGADPYSEEGISQGLPLGDRAVVYPGKNGYVGSLRLAAMRDGLQDHEYLCLLEDRLAAMKKRLGPAAAWLDPRQRPTELCRNVVQSFYHHTRDGSTLLSTREAIAGEIDALDAGTYLYVQTEPAEGSEVPAGPRMINLRGVAEPGAAVSINGTDVTVAGADGTFACCWFISTPEITVRASKDGRIREAVRRFRLIE